MLHSSKAQLVVVRFTNTSAGIAVLDRGRSICDTSLAVLFVDTDNFWAILHQVERK